MVWKWLSQIFNCKFYNYSNSRDDINETSKISRAIVKLLKDDDHVVVNQTVVMIQRILKSKNIDVEMIENTPEMVESLIDVLNSSSDERIISCTLGILHILSQCKTGSVSICQSNGIPVLIQLLSAEDYKLNAAIATLHNLLRIDEGCKADICEVGGLQKLVSLLQRSDEKFLSIVIDCLRILAYQNQDNKLFIFSNNVPAELVRILSTSSCQTLLCCTSRLLKTLSDCSSNKRAIIAAGGMQELMKHLSNQNNELVANCLLTLRNLSEALNERENVGSFLNILV